MLTNKLEKNVILYKVQFDKLSHKIFGGYKLDRTSLELDGLSFRIKYMITHSKDLDKINDMKKEFSNKALQLRSLFGEILQEFLYTIITIPENCHVEDIIDILAQDVEIDTTYVKFKMVIISNNIDYLQYVDNVIDSSKPFNMFPNEYFRFTTDSYNDAIAKAYPELFENKHQDKIGTGADGDVFCHSFTFQTSEACNLSCTYCVYPDTNILMADFTEKHIKDIEVGDEILAFEENKENNKQRSLIKTKVTNKFINPSPDKIYEVTSSSIRSPLMITGEHPIVTNRGWHDIEDLYKSTSPNLYPNYNIISEAPYTDVDIYDENYVKGYFLGAFIGDGTVRLYHDDDGFIRYFSRFVVKDDEMNIRMREYAKILGFNFYDINFKISMKYDVIRQALLSRKDTEYYKYNQLYYDNLTPERLNTTSEFLIGFTAGIYDAEGSFNQVIRINNTNTYVFYIIEQALLLLNITWTYDRLNLTTNNVKLSLRITGGIKNEVNFIKSIKPAIKRKGLERFIGTSVFSGCNEYKINKKQSTEEYVYNLETETHTYIANGFMVHNCYQFAKTPMRMEFETAKKFIDNLLADKYGYINRYNSPAIIIEFIGGEPFLEIELTRKIYEYFLDRCYELNHPWFNLHRVSICSNGLLYFEPEVQSFFKDYSQNISFNISIDGNKELHDACRVQPNGEGSYDICMAALNHYNKNYSKERNSKMTLAPSNISHLFDSVVDFINNGMRVININCVFEEGWSQETAREEYYQLKKLADYLIDNDLDSIYIAIFNERQEDVQDKYSDGTFCGGSGSMLAMRPNGQFYPCIRYMPTSVGPNVEDLCIGNVDDGLDERSDHSNILERMDNLTRRSMVNDICWDCPISNDCPSCFKAGTLIETDNGPIPIEQLKVGDKVLTRSGEYHYITHIHCRRATSDETLEIKFVGSPTIYTTRDHPFLVRHRIGVSTKRRDQGKPIYGEPEWVKADDILLSDRVCMLFKSFGDIDFDKNLAYIAGRWLGDGWRTDHKSWNGKFYPEFHICCGKHEEYEMFNILKESGIEYSDYGEGITVHQFLIKSNTRNEKNKILVELLKKCGKYSHGKMIPEEVFNWNQNSVKSFLEGYLSADGSFDITRPNMIRFSSVSKKLAYGFSNILRMFGINPSYSERHPHMDVIEGRIVGAKLSYDIRGSISDKQLKYHIDENDHTMWSSVRIIKALGASYDVYNISVEDDPTYYADGVLVHNCTAMGHTVFGTFTKRASFICIQMIAEALANVYYWNRLKLKHPEYNLPVRKNNVPKEWALLVIGEDELDELMLLESYTLIHNNASKYIGYTI